MKKILIHALILASVTASAFADISGQYRPISEKCDELAQLGAAPSLPINRISPADTDLIINFDRNKTGICGEGSLYGVLKINIYDSTYGTAVYDYELIKKPCDKYDSPYSAKGKFEVTSSKIAYKIDYSRYDFLCSVGWPDGLRVPCVKKIKYDSVWSLVENSDETLTYTYKDEQVKGQCVFQKI